MSDLDDDLLALAGGDDDFGSESENEAVAPVKRSKGGDGDNDEDNEDDDDDEVFAKKRRVDTSDLEPYDDAGDDDEDEEEEEEEDDDEEGEEDDLVNPYPLEGKYKNEQDREELESMDEIQREQILFDRTQEMERYNEKKYLQQRMKLQKKLKTASTPGAKGSRSSNRTKDSSKQSSKRDKLSELRKQREQKVKRATRKYDEYEDDEDEEESDDDLRGEDEEEESDDYDDGVVAWGGASKSKPKRSTELAKLEDINKIRLGRSKLSKYCFYTDFNEAAVNCFAKVNLGIDKRTRKPMYRLVKVIDVESKPSKAYKLGNFKCDLFLVVSQNKKQTKEFPLSIFSDSPISHEEFDRYLKELDKTGETIDFLDDVNDKYEQLQVFFNRGLSDKDVNEMIARKQKLQGVREDEITGYDAVKRKSRLMDELKIAKQQANPQKVREIIDKLKKLDNILINQTKSQNNSVELNSMSKVNERNRKLNSTNIRKAEIKSRNNIQVADGGDPFSRLKTTTRIFYQDLINQENEKALNDAKANYQDLLDEKNKQEEKIAKSTYRELGEMDKLIKSIDFDVEIEI
ncbi:uncharacterized protein RJT20DRAFT_133793 [Scheffersomyces xylosifermentans]|uniref:uncharacterized protein n=1 Tax=Scheffersomyces xylosifermentans TaxID=1304137 RepID=UPI00315CE0F8